MYYWKEFADAELYFHNLQNGQREKVQTRTQDKIDTFLHTFLNQIPKEGRRRNFYDERIFMV